MPVSRRVADALSEVERLGVVELLRTEPSFRRLWLSQVVSELGDWFQFVAIATMFPTKEGGAAVIAGLIVARHVVATLMSPIAGVIADRYNRGRVMIVADLARLVISLGFLLVHGKTDLALVVVLSLLLEAFSMVFEPARGAAIPQIVPPAGLYAANALGGATWSAMLALGAMAGGATAALIGVKSAFVLNAASFGLSAVFVAMAKIPDLPREANDDRSSGGVREGIRYLRDHPAERSLLTLKAGALFSGGVFVLVTVFADELFADPSSVFGRKGMLMGMMLAGRGLGALTLPFVMGRLTGSDVRGVARALLVGFPLAIVFFCGFAGAPSVWIAAAALFFAHGGTATIWVSSTQLFQVTVPNRVLGRVLSFDLAFVTLSVAIVNAIVAAALTRSVPPRVVALCLGCAFFLPFLGWIRTYRVHLPALERAAKAQTDTSTVNVSL